MSTIQIKKEWQPESTTNQVEMLSKEKQVNFFTIKRQQPKKLLTAEDLIGLSWILFEDNAITAKSM